MELTNEQLIQKAPHKFVGSLIKHNQFNIGSEAQRIKNIIDEFGNSEKIHFIPDEEGSNTTIKYIKDEFQAYAQHQFQYELTPMTVTVDNVDYQTFPQQIVIGKNIAINNNTLYTLNNNIYTFLIKQYENLILTTNDIEQGSTSGGNNIPSTTTLRIINRISLPAGSTSFSYKVNTTDPTKTYKIWYLYYKTNGSYVSGGRWNTVPTDSDEIITVSIPSNALPIKEIRFEIAYGNETTILPDVIDSIIFPSLTSYTFFTIKKNEDNILSQFSDSQNFFITADNTTKNAAIYSDNGLIYNFGEQDSQFLTTINNF